MYVKVKCLISRCIGVLGLLILWPVFLIIAVLIKLDSEGPVFFKQQRLGLKGKPFEIYKFRYIGGGGDPGTVFIAGIAGTPDL